MSTSLPRLYRSLEQRSGSAALDQAVRTAVATFLALRQPNARHTADLSRLIASSWTSLTEPTRLRTAAALRTSAYLPREIADLLDGKTEPGATEKSSRDVCGVHVPATRGAAIRPDAVADEDRSGDEPPSNADRTRETLRRMVQPGHSMAETGNAAPAPRIARNPTDLVDQVSRCDSRDAFRVIAAFAGLTDSHGEAMAREESGLLLAKTLKAVRMGTVDAMTVLILLKPAIALSAHAYQQMKEVYRTLDCETSRAELGLFCLMQPQHIEPQPRSQTASADRAPRGGEPRKSFGRRLSAPSVAATTPQGRSG